MTLEKAREAIASEIGEARRLKGETRQEIQAFHRGRYDGLMFAKKALASVGEDILKPLRKELEKMAAMSSRLGASAISETEKARRYAEAWAYRKALDLIESEIRGDGHEE